MYRSDLRGQATHPCVNLTRGAWKGETISKRTAFWLAWCIWVLYVVIAIVTLLLQIRDDPSAWLNDMFDALILLAFATVGSLIASRRPENPIGWIFCISTLLWALGSLMQEYAVYTLITVPGSLPAGALLGVIGHWIVGIGWFLMLTFLLLLFPNGHLPSPRWRFLAWLIAVLLTVYSITFLLSPYPYANSAIDPRLAAVGNPMGILIANDLFDQLAGNIPLALFPTIIACIVSVFLRFRRARGVERQQLKWFAYGMTLSILMLIVIVILIFSNVNGAPGTLFYLAVVCIPISAGIAILRYRLYDIDVLINRTLVYGTLSALLALLYFGLIFALQSLFQGLFKQNNAVAIVVSTLVIAALFQPLRRRIQEIIDRRFYRRKYDSAKTLEAFSATLRNEVDLGQLREHLLKVVQETMQPVHVSLWLRSPQRHTEESRRLDRLE
jgi:hypothetical protein